MNISLIGTGNMARGIGHRLVAGGHSITLIGKDPEETQKLVAELNLSAHGKAEVQTATLDDVALGDVVILAVWYGVNMEVARQLGSRLENKVVVDIANPLNSTYDGLATLPGSSSAEELAKVVPSSARVVKAFNTTFAGTLVAGNVNGTPLNVFIAGDDKAAKQKVSELIADGGMVAVDGGPLERARQLEGLGLLGITLNVSNQLGFNTAWEFVHPN